MSTPSVLSNLPALHSEGGLPRYLAAIRNFPLLSAADEAMYARRWHENGDREAAYRLVTSHLRLAAQIALRYRGERRSDACRETFQPGKRRPSRHLRHVVDQSDGP
jgi:DNA-directed RNA polymerase sigma subunit (sigma70/sigma32)